MSTGVKLKSINVMCVTAVGGPLGVQAAMDEVEKKLGKDLRGRKCYGVISHKGSEMNYRACVASKSGDNPKSLGLETGKIPAGKYIRERIKKFDYRKDVPKILKTFEKLAGENKVDKKRPSLEFYRRHDEILIHVPIK